MRESRNKKETKGKVPQREREKLRYEMRGGSYISEKKTSTPMCPFVNKRAGATIMKEAERRYQKIREERREVSVHKGA